MDAARYQQLQDLFWEAEELDPSQWRTFLIDRTGADVELMESVLSLLREHDPETALLEGSRAQVVKLPPTVRGTVQTEVGSTPRSHRLDDPEPSSETIPSSQRTHASPRAIGPVGRSPQRRARSSSNKTVVKTQRTSSPAVGSWIPFWFALWAAMMGSILVASWSMGRGAARADWDLGRRVLPIALQQARSQIDLQLVRERERTYRIAAGRGRRVVEMSAVQDNPVTNAIAVQEVLSELVDRNDTEFEVAIWDRDFQCLAASSGLHFGVDQPDLEKSLTQLLVSKIRTCLGGEAVFCGFSTESALPFDPDRIPMGWIVPIYRNEPSIEVDPDENPIGAVMLLRYSLQERLQTILNQVSHSGGVDAYLVNRQGVMQTESRLARSFLGLPALPGVAALGREDSMDPATAENRKQESNDFRIAGKFRVAEYGGAPPRLDSSRDQTQWVPPLTIAASSLARWSEADETRHRTLPGQPSPEDTQSYLNYAGVPHQGVWKWFSSYDFGLIVERPSRYPPEVLDLKRWVAWTAPFSIAWPVTAILSALALPIVSALTWWHQVRIWASESKNRPLARYAIEQELGVGGMGIVYLAKHKDLGRKVAIKLLRSDCQGEDDRHRFEREARLAATLSCPHSVTIFDYGYTTEGYAFCVMELLQGITLAEVVARSGPQSPRRVVWVLQQICQSILEAHAKGLMHRDLKPQNVMLSLDPVVGDWAVVFDFGLAKPIEPDRDMFQTAETIWAGTPMYMAPERFREPSIMDPRSDIYSIGCIAYYLLAGNPPFAECDPESMFGLIMTQLPINISTHRGEEIDESLDQWVRDCMSKNKRERASDLIRMNRQLQSIAEPMPWSRADAEAWWAEHG